MCENGKICHSSHLAPSNVYVADTGSLSQSLLKPSLEIAACLMRTRNTTRRSWFSHHHQPHSRSRNYRRRPYHIGYTVRLPSAPRRSLCPSRPLVSASSRRTCTRGCVHEADNMLAGSSGCSTAATSVSPRAA
eukprot:TRINITY_DN20435_c0_g1_i1.p2 TRINITY_DN20435_c0_g1~~TRINITY_DN20435_c0_g1_i1.p2  ORF type:complete len:133 (-),score=3.14 TRINITY_DN20435_c0_g1_i1:88-486(-)